MKLLFESINEALDPTNKFGKEATNIPEIEVKLAGETAHCVAYFTNPTSGRFSKTGSVCHLKVDYWNDSVWLTVTANGSIVLNRADNADAIKRNSITVPDNSTPYPIVNGESYGKAKEDGIDMSVELDDESKKELVSMLKDAASGKGKLYGNLKMTLDKIEEDN